jgi:hypothetical protein
MANSWNEMQDPFTLLSLLQVVFSTIIRVFQHISIFATGEYSILTKSSIRIASFPSQSGLFSVRQLIESQFDLPNIL